MNKRFVLIGVVLVGIVLVPSLSMSLLPVIVATLVETTVRVVPQEVTVQPYEKFTVAVVVENVSELYSLDIKLGWNATRLQYINHTVTIPVEDYPQGILHEPVSKIKDEVSTNSCWIAYSSLSPAPSFNGSGTVFTMTFKALNLLNTTMLVLTSALVNVIGQSIFHVVANGIVIVMEHLEKKQRIEVVKHIVTGQNITAGNITEWLRLENETWFCSFIFVQVGTYNHTAYDNSQNNASKVNVWAVPNTTRNEWDPTGDISEAQGNEVKLTDGNCTTVHIKNSTLSHELGHIFGLTHNKTDQPNVPIDDPNNLMYPDNQPGSCHRTGTDVTQDQQRRARESAKRFLAKDAGQGQDVYDAVGNPIDAFMDIKWAEGWAEYANMSWTLHLTLTVVSFSNVSYWLGFLIESDSNRTTGEPVEGIDYILSFNPANNLVNFSRYDVGWTSLDPTGITHEFTYLWKDSDAPPIINGISFSFPLTKLDRKAGNSVSVRAVTYNSTYTDQAPDTGFLIIGNLVPPVGSIYIPVDKLALLAPYIALASAVILAVAATAIFKHRKKR